MKMFSYLTFQQFNYLTIDHYALKQIINENSILLDDVVIAVENSRQRDEEETLFIDGGL